MMVTSSMVERSENFLRSAPVPVRMAGFEGTTADLQKAGWQIAVEVRRDMYHFMKYELDIAFKHPGIRQYMLGRLWVDGMETNSLIPHLHAGIDIICIAPQIQMQIMPSQKISMSFAAIDARPEMVSMKRVNLEDLAVFRPVNISENFEIYLAAKDEREIMELILQKQDLKQKEIRQNMRRRDFLATELAEKGITDPFASEVRHQLLVVNG